MRQRGILDYSTQRIVVVHPDQARPGNSRFCHLAAQYVDADSWSRLAVVPTLRDTHDLFLWPFGLEDYGRDYEQRNDWRA